MIKIIKHGKLRPLTCGICGCVFTYEKEDVRVEQLGYNEERLSLNCPDCGSELKIDDTVYYK